MLSRFHHLTEEYFILSFISGFNDELRKSTTLYQVFFLVRLQENALTYQQTPSKPHISINPTTSSYILKSNTRFFLSNPLHLHLLPLYYNILVSSHLQFFHQELLNYIPLIYILLKNNRTKDALKVYATNAMSNTNRDIVVRLKNAS